MFRTEPVLHIEEQLAVHMWQCPETNSTSEVSDRSVSHMLHISEKTNANVQRPYKFHKRKRPLWPLGVKQCTILNIGRERNQNKYKF